MVAVTGPTTAEGGNDGLTMTGLQQDRLVDPAAYTPLVSDQWHTCHLDLHHTACPPCRGTAFRAAFDLTLAGAHEKPEIVMDGAAGSVLCSCRSSAAGSGGFVTTLFGWTDNCSPVHHLDPSFQTTLVMGPGLEGFEHGSIVSMEGSSSSSAGSVS